DLQAFLVLSEAGSFQRAAEQINISQSALTRRIQKLEDALGVTLIQRTTRSMKLTLAAREFRSHAQFVLDEMEIAMRAVGAETTGGSGHRKATVTVAAVPTATHKILPNAISMFRREGHKAAIRISDLSANDVLDAVAVGEADFGINFFGSQEPELDFRPLLDDPFVLALHRDDTLTSKSSIKWSEIDGDRFITVWKGSGNRMLLDSELARAGHNLAWSYEVRHLSTALALVEAGVGNTALPASAMPSPDHPLLTSRPLIEPSVHRTVGVVRRAGRKLSAAADTFYDVLVRLSASST
ncbi:MAG: hypothetical protein RLZ98_3265, partial [Pseudomonadota bacterium]